MQSMTSANARAFAFVCFNSNTEDDGPKSVKRPQGIVAGVGFLGTGLIVRNNKGRLVHGLTTAACVWVAASIGAACGCAECQIVVLGAALVLVVLVLADRSRNQFIGAGRARNRVTSRSRRSTKRGFLARCLAHITNASSNRISARFVRSWQSSLSNFSLNR
jgi:uncharacterized membrane protein YhiD involved in acid resistance